MPQRSSDEWGGFLKLPLKGIWLECEKGGRERKKVNWVWHFRKKLEGSLKRGNCAAKATFVSCEKNLESFFYA